MQGVQHVVESRGIGVNVHLPSVALKAFVGGSHGHCWVELRYLLRHLLYTVSTYRWVKARSDRFVSSWSKRHMLTRTDLRDAAKHCEYVGGTAALNKMFPRLAADTRCTLETLSTNALN